MRPLTDVLAERGWLRLPAFVTARRALLPPAGITWRPLTPTVGRVRQAGAYIQLPLRDAPQAVRCFADDLCGVICPARGLGCPHPPGLRPFPGQSRRGLCCTETRSCSKTALPPVAFNEVTWQRYTPTAGHISAHRDQARYTGVIAVCTLVGEAPFSLLSQRDPDLVVAWWLAGPGDLVLLRGAGFGHREARCPLHRVDPPSRGERLTLALRWREGARGMGMTAHAAG